jgi:Mn-dependent DtxR family transcriptional regulator
MEFWGKGSTKELSEELKITEKEAENLLLKLESEKLIKVVRHDGKIYGQELTNEGTKIYYNDEYLNWKLELGY